LITNRVCTVCVAHTKTACRPWSLGVLLVGRLAGCGAWVCNRHLSKTTVCCTWHAVFWSTALYVCIGFINMCMCCIHSVLYSMCHSLCYIGPFHISPHLSFLLITQVWYDVETYAAYEGNRRASIDTPLSKVCMYVCTCVGTYVRTCWLVLLATLAETHTNRAPPVGLFGVWCTAPEQRYWYAVRHLWFVC